jgi:N-acetylneuraminate lyase
VAGAAPSLPFFYYHLPSMTGVDIFVAPFLEAAAERIPNLAGAKFTHENLADFLRCVRLDGGRYTMLFGRDEMLLAGLALGAPGAVGSTYNLMAPVFLRMIAAFEAGDLEAARAEQAKATEAIVAMLPYGGVPAFKAAMKLIGLDLGPVRPPLRPLDEDQTESLRCDLEAVGFFDFCSAP